MSWPEPTDYVGQLRAVARAVRFSGGWFAWLGQRQPPPAKVLREAMPPNVLRRRLLVGLTVRLYLDFYCTGRPQPQRHVDNRLPANAMSDLVHALSGANAGTGQVQDGWEFVARGEDAIELRRQGLVFLVDSSLVLSGSLDTDVRIRVPREMLGYSPGYYMALSDRQFPRDGEPIFRLYWNLLPNAAAQFVSAATGALNRRRVPFLLKVANGTDRFQRCDNAVLYLGLSDLEACMPTLRTVYADLRLSLRASVPALTKPLAPGVGLAEDPGNGESFGWHRSQLLAEALLRANEMTAVRIEDRLDSIAERIREAGIDPTAPYRGAQSVEPTINLRLPAKRSKQHFATQEALSVATAIGAQLTRDAMWWDGRCSWVGAEPIDLSIPNARPSWSTVSADLYEGSAGIAVFLAELGTRTGDSVSRSCAVGAMRQSLETADACPPISRLGLFLGWTGIALSAIRVGALLGVEELYERGRNLCLRATLSSEALTRCDVMSGRAGAVLALTSLYRLVPDPVFLLRARVLADQLLAQAERSEDGMALSWRNDGNHLSPGLTGYSHGASGLAHAFLELFDATGDTAYKTAALQAFAYERLHYDRHAANWRDLRQQIGSIRRARFVNAWCHGAPGIALARLRAVELLGSGIWQDELSAALNTTALALSSALTSVRSNFSLCHGLAGNADILLEAERRLGQGMVPDRSLVVRTAAYGAQLHGRWPTSWPCGAGHGLTPGLMLGLSGIGLFYLRLHDPTVPSTLLCRILA